MTATRKSKFIFLRGCTKLHEDAANHSAGIGMGVVYQLWHQLFTVIFYVFRLTNKGNLLFAVIFLFYYVDFIRYGT